MVGTLLRTSHKGLTLKKSRLLFAIALAALTAGGLPAVAQAGPTSTRPTAASHHTAKNPQRRPVQLAAGSSSPAEAMRRSAGQPAPVNRPVLPHLDPALNQVAGVAAQPGTPPVPVAADGTVQVQVSGPGAAAAARAVGARTVSSYAGQTVLAVRPDQLKALAAKPDVGQVSVPRRLVELSSSQGVHSSSADAWQSAPPNGLADGGAGVKVGIVDVGFGGLDAEIAAGNLDAATVVRPAATAHACDNTDQMGSDHGTAVAEVVHQMAPQATLYLYCAVTPIGFSEAADQIIAAGIKIVNSSIGLVGESRGDGSGAPGTTEYAVQKARRAGVLWIQSAGNSADLHWGGTLSDANHNAWLNLRGTSEVDGTALDPNGSGDIVLTWDQWPASSLPITLCVEEYHADNATPVNVRSNGQLLPYQVVHTPGTAPTLVMSLTNSSTELRYYDAWVRVGAVPAGGDACGVESPPATVPAIHYDLFYEGPDFYPSYLAYLDPGVAAQGSINQPASSPYALAVGAAYWQDNSLEPFSSRGPTVDGRVKPDLTGYDGVASNITDETSTAYDSSNNPVNTGFYGTSAAAPHVAGAAALVAAANPAMDASQIEAFLESPNEGAGAVNPPISSVGHGLLNLGNADQTLVHPPAGAAYFPLPNPVRIVDTRNGLGAPKSPLHAGTELRVKVPTSYVPADASSVVIELSGTGAKGGTYLAVYPNNYGGVGTDMLSALEPNTSVETVVRLDPRRPGNPTGNAFKVRNEAAQTDALVALVGYFGPPGGTGGLGYVPIASKRVLDTRVPLGGPKGPMQPNQAITVNTTTAGVPSTASVAVVNITALNHYKGGYLTAYPASSPAISSVDYATVSRPNQVLVPIVNGRFVLQNRFATADAIVEVLGYFSSDATSRFVALPSPVRIADTRNGKGGRHTPLTSTTPMPLDASLNGVPYSATGLWIGMTAIGLEPDYRKGNGYLTVYANDAAWPHVTNLNFTGQRSILNNAIASLSARTASAPPGYTTSVTGVNVNVIEDALGYFVPPAG